MKSGDYSIINTDKLIPLDHSAKTTTNNKSAETQSMEHTLRDILRQLDITNSTWCKNDEDCYVQENHIGHRCNSTVNVIPCTIQFHAHGHRIEEENSKFIEESEIELFVINSGPVQDTLLCLVDLILASQNYDNNSAWNRFLSSVKSRLAVAQVVENVKTHATLTFDFIFLILISTSEHIMCAIGLVENSNVYLLSSMLICPMMII
ncbi:hypothetical protein NQ318_005075 [Aromia moschata]|uniref:Uncharacterized protein n=1 Tax=Aromia moschata TaxID=1265417 RepID=A0AAV8YGT1_9CUCU|nr:hypothetical protein NQ318_005075 [Aromia moschata]